MFLLVILWGFVAKVIFVLVFPLRCMYVSECTSAMGMYQCVDISVSNDVC